MPLLKFQCRHRYAGGFSLDLAFQMEHRFTALFGPSGSGKTSVLSMVAGFVRPQEGRITLGDRVLADSARGVWLSPDERRVGMVYQDSLLFPHLTVEGNLRYGWRWRRRRARSIEFSRVVDVLEIGPLLARLPRNLSGGERQRVALGRALLSAPEILLMDEPLASLDGTLKRKVLAYLERVVAEWDIPALYVTHAQTEVRRAAQWVTVIHQGRLVSSGTPDEALVRPEPLGWSNSAGPVNLLRADSVEPDGARRVARIGSQQLLLPPGEIPTGTPLFVQFLPSDVIVAQQDVAGLSARNHLRGRVCRVINANQAVFVAIDAGQVFWAEVTPEAARELDLVPGRDVTCFIKVHQLSVVG